MTSCRIHPKARLAILGGKLAKFAQKAGGKQRSFLLDVFVRANRANRHLLQEKTVLRLINPTCPACMAETRELRDRIREEVGEIGLVAVLPEDPRLDAYLSGGLAGWALVIDADASIAECASFNYSPTHSVFLVAPQTVLASFEGQAPKAVDDLIKALHAIEQAL